MHIFSKKKIVRMVVKYMNNLEMQKIELQGTKKILKTTIERKLNHIQNIINREQKNISADDYEPAIEIIEGLLNDVLLLRDNAMRYANYSEWLKGLEKIENEQ
jgi:hypothetical protein